MKRVIALLTTCILLLCLFGCNEKSVVGEQSGTTTTTAPTLSDYDKAFAALDEGKVGEAFRLLSSSTDERAADLLRHFVWQKTRVAYEGKNAIPYTYDEKGYLKTIYYSKKQTDTYTWNADGTLQSVFIDYGGVFWEKGTYTYQNGLLSAFSRVDKDGKRYKRTYTYNDKGNLLVEKCTSHYAGDNETDTYTYDENGKCVFKKEADYTGKVWATATYTYDEAGRLIKRVRSYDEDYDGKLESTSTLTRTYNEKGKLTSESEQDSSSGYTSTYDEAGRLIKKNHTWSDGSSGVVTYTYDNFGRSTGFCTTVDGEPNYGYSLIYNDENDTCLQKYLDGNDRIEYRLFYYPHAVNKQLLETAGDWIEYYDKDLP